MDWVWDDVLHVAVKHTVCVVHLLLQAVASYHLFHSHAQVIISNWLNEVNMTITTLPWSSEMVFNFTSDGSEMGQTLDYSAVSQVHWRLKSLQFLKDTGMLIIFMILLPFFISCPLFSNHDMRVIPVQSSQEVQMSREIYQPLESHMKTHLPHFNCQVSLSNDHFILEDAARG